MRLSVPGFGLATKPVVLEPDRPTRAAAYSTRRESRDVDKDDVTVKGKSKTKVDGDGVATSGTMSTYALTPRADVDLASHVGHEVQLSAVVVEPGHGDADVTIEDTTTADP